MTPESADLTAYDSSSGGGGGGYGAVREYDEDHVCTIEADAGPCSGYYRRWHYDPASETCKEFIFTGCSGNGNNFETRRRCEEVCGSRYGVDSWQLRAPFKDLEPMSSIIIRDGEEYSPAPTRQLIL